MHEKEVFLAAVSYMCLGACVLALVYHAVLYVYFRDRVLLHYVVYLACMGLFIFIRSDTPNILFGDTAASRLYDWFNEGIQILSFTAYINFGVQALDLARDKNSGFYKAWLVLTILLLVYTGIVVVVNSAGRATPDEVRVIFRVFIFGMCIAIMWRLFALPKSVYQGLILVGCVYFFVCGLMSFLSNLDLARPLILAPLYWLLVGNIGDILLFSSAMGYRLKRTYDERQTALAEAADERTVSERLRFESKEAVLQARMEERNRIARDIHDDLGSGLTKIAVMSEVAKTQLLQPDKAISQLEHISNSSRELVDSLQDVIWILSARNDSLTSLTVYLREYTLKFFETFDSVVLFECPDAIDGIRLPEAYRRNIFLVIKETLHNIAKHACCRSVTVCIGLEGNILRVVISDDGKGFDMDNVRLFGNGIENMRSRMQQIGGIYVLETGPGRGTRTELSVPV